MITPILRWAGSKRRYARRIATMFPDRILSYSETFAGSMSVLIQLINTGQLKPGAKVTLRDTGPCLGLIRALVLSPDALARDYHEMRASVSGMSQADAYACARDSLRKAMALGEGEEPRNAAKLLLVNQLGFNGLFRVNKLGVFNVPIGTRKHATAIESKILDLGAALNRYSVTVTRDITDCLANEIYCDPPYLGGFTGYTAKGFDRGEHIKLAAWCKLAATSGCHVVLSNNDSADARAIYSQADHFDTLGRKNTISADASTRGETIGEILAVYRAGRQ